MAQPKAQHSYVGMDYAGRQHKHAIFGDAVVALREPDILVQFQYNISSNDVTTTTSGTGATSHALATATLSSGATVGAARLESANTVRYQPGFDSYGYFTAAFSAADAGTYQRAGLFDTNNGFWLGQEDGTFMVSRRSGASDNTQEPPAIPGFDPTKLNIYRISYGWLGVAPSMFEVFLNQRWTVLDIIDVTNAQTEPSILQPVQPICMEAGRTSGSGAVTIKTCSWSAGRLGSNGATSADRQGSIANSKSGITTETNIITLRNASTFQGLTNRVVLEFDFGSFSSEGNKPVELFLKKNATLGGSPSFTDIDATNSVISFDVAGTTVTGGTIVGAASMAKVDTVIVTPSQGVAIKLLPGEDITISALSANATEVGAGLSWRELF